MLGRNIEFFSGENRECGHIQGLANFLGTPIIPGTGKATYFKFCTHIHKVNQTKSPWKFGGKVAVGVVTDSRKFSGHPYMGRIARSSLRCFFFRRRETVEGIQTMERGLSYPSWLGSMRPAGFGAEPRPQITLRHFIRKYVLLCTCQSRPNAFWKLDVRDNKIENV